MQPTTIRLENRLARALRRMLLFPGLVVVSLFATGGTEHRTPVSAPPILPLAQVPATPSLAPVTPIAQVPATPTTAPALPTASPTPARADAVVSIELSAPYMTSQFDVGVTHMQYSLDPWGDPASVTQARSVLANGVRYQNQHIMGFGADNINPSPGVYDWSTLDRRIDMIRSMGAVPVITLCCAPDWMKGGASGTTDWTQIEAAPLPEHYPDFANLAREVALRYRDVRHYLVWNEMKGFWDPERGNWDYVAYTTFYNVVYDAVKSVDPGIQVGGPYLVIEGTGSSRGGGWPTASPMTPRNREVLDHWLRNKRGADFIVLDRALVDFHDPNTYTEAEVLDLTSQFARVAEQVRSMTPLPIWWAEDSVPASDDWDFQAVALGSMLYHELLSGSAVSLRWQPQGVAGMAHRGNDQNLFSDTRQPGGGQPFPNYDVYKSFNDHFRRGTALYRATSGSPDLEVLASAAQTMLINKRPIEVRAVVNGTEVALSGYSVTVVPTPRPASTTGTGSSPVDLVQGLFSVP
ncbi:MAG: xylan 1,4-beta-xylosidase [Chloroflexi bacterium]|nr:xylan 1,4-beta-xylosidase [Chloroflexota bacterium]